MATAETYHLHPVLLDACFQVLGAAATDQVERAGIYLPVGIEHLQVFASVGITLWSQVTLQERTSQQLRADVTLVDPAGRIVAHITGLLLRYASRQGLQRLLQDPHVFDRWLYQLTWQPQGDLPTPPLPPPTVPAPGHWLIFADQQGQGHNLAARLRGQGQICVVVVPGPTYRKTADQQYQLNPQQPEAFGQLLQENTNADRPIQGIVHLWSLDHTTLGTDLRRPADSPNP